MLSNTDIQWIINKSILQKSEKFDYQSIYKDIKTELMKQGVSGNILNSFKLEDMIKDTLNNLIQHKKLCCFKELYIPLKSNNCT